MPGHNCDVLCVCLRFLHRNPKRTETLFRCHLYLLDIWDVTNDPTNDERLTRALCTPQLNSSRSSVPLEVGPGESSTGLRPRFPTTSTGFGLSRRPCSDFPVNL